RGAGSRVDEDDRPAGDAQGRQGVARERGAGGDVEGEDALPLPRGRLLDAGGRGDAGGVDECIDLCGDQLLELVGEQIRGMGHEALRTAGELYERLPGASDRDRRSTRLNSSHVSISYAVCL